MLSVLMGPGSLAIMLFVVESTIKVIAFDSEMFFFDISPKLSLWATAIFFTLSISNRLTRGDEEYYQVKKELFCYLLISIFSWIISFTLSYKASILFEQMGLWTNRIYCYVILSLFISGLTLGLAVKLINKED